MPGALPDRETQEMRCFGLFRVALAQIAHFAGDAGYAQVLGDDFAPPKPLLTNQSALSLTPALAI